MNWITQEFKPIPEKPNGWYTIREISEQSGHNSKTVADRIYNMVKEGKLEVMECKVNGKRAKCYRPKSKK